MVGDTKIGITLRTMFRRRRVIARAPAYPRNRRRGRKVGSISCCGNTPAFSVPVMISWNTFDLTGLDPGPLDVVAGHGERIEPSIITTWTQTCSTSATPMPARNRSPTTSAGGWRPTPTAARRSSGTSTSHPTVLLRAPMRRHARAGERRHAVAAPL